MYQYYDYAPQTALANPGWWIMPLAAVVVITLICAAYRSDYGPLFGVAALIALFLGVSMVAKPATYGGGYPAGAVYSGGWQ